MKPKKNWPDNFFESIRIDDPDFKRPDQGVDRPIDLGEPIEKSDDKLPPRQDKK